ncbi:MAG: hypothetical protein QG671_3505 [Actinomycetota bacterium]|nr:hypothetical protein [Actinomycetota bacterium]
MSQGIKVYRELEFGRGGMGGNMAGPVWTVEAFNNAFGTELLTNAGFETAGGGDPDFFGTWTEYAGTGTIADEGSLVNAGSHAAKLTAGTSYNTYIYQAATVTAGKQYTVTFYTRTGDTAAAGRYKIYDASNSADIVALASTGIAATTYAKMTRVFTAPAGCSSVRIYLYCPATNGKIAYFDTVSVLQAASLGDVVIWDTTNTTADLFHFTSTTSAADQKVMGMVYSNEIPNQQIGRVQIWGPTASLKANGTSPIVVGDLLCTYTAVGRAAKASGTGAFARAQEALASGNGTLDAFIQCVGVPLPPSTVTGVGDDTTLDFGASTDITVQWNSTANELQIAYAAANTAIRVGDATQGDVILTGNAATDLMTWDGSANTLHFTNASKVGFGNASTAPNLSISASSTDVTIAVGTDDSAIAIGNGTNSADLVVYGNASTDKLTWDASVNTLSVTDNVKIGLGNNATTPDVSVYWDASKLQVAFAIADSVIQIGSATQGDVVLVGNAATDLLTWDGSGNTLHFTNASKVGFGNASSAPNLSISANSTDVTIAVGTDDSAITVGDGTLSADVVVYGNTTDDKLTWDASGKTLHLTNGSKVGLGNAATAPNITVSATSTDVTIAVGTDDTAISLGNGTQSADLIVYGNTATDILTWDASANTLSVTDNTKIGFGNNTTSPDISVYWDASQLQIAYATANTAIKIGDATQGDVILTGNTATDLLTWDGSENTLHFTNTSKAGFGGTSAAPNITVSANATDVTIAVGTDDTAITVGDGTKDADLVVYGNAGTDKLTWDASANTLSVTDNVKVGFGNNATSPDVSVYWDASQLQVAFATTDGGVIIGGATEGDVKIFGATTDDYAQFDGSASNLDLRGAYDIRIANIGTLDFPSQVAGNATFTVTGLTSSDIVIISPRETTVGSLVVDKVEAEKLTIRNSASETSNVECNYYVLAKAS